MKTRTFSLFALKPFLMASFLLILSAPLAFAVSDADFIDSETGKGLIKANSIRSEHFRFEYSNLIAEQTDSDGDGIPDLVETTAHAAETSHDIFVDTLGYADPMDGEVFRILFIFDDTDQYLIPGSIGVTSVLSNGNPYIAIDPWLGEDYLEATTAHEYFHAIQFGYDDISWAYTDQGTNVAESTATWSEEEVYTDVNDYIYYLGDYFDYTDYSIFAGVNPSGTLYQYALNVWPRFLSEYYNDDVILDILELYFDSGDFDSGFEYYDAVNAVVASQGGDLRDVYHDFARWNLDLSLYPDGSIYPEVFFISQEANGEYATIEGTYAPALFGTNYLYFDNDSGADDFNFHFLKTEGISYYVSLVPIENGDPKLEDGEVMLVDQYEQLGSEMVLEDISNSEAVVAIVSALDQDFDRTDDESFDIGYLYDFIGSFEGSLSDVIEVSADLAAADDKEGDLASEVEEVRVPETLTLSVLGFDEDSVSLSWNRVFDADIVEYWIEYTEEGEDSEIEVSDNVNLTFATIGGLEEDVTYTFQITSVDSDGETVKEPSNTVTVKPEAWLFTDVSPVHEYADMIEYLVNLDVFDGYDDGSFGLFDEINRAELLKTLIESRGITPSAGQYRNCFPDVNEEWFARYVCYAAEEGWVQGYSDGSFRPGNTVNKVEALKILFNVFETNLVEGSSVVELPYSDLSLDAWYSIYVWKASKLGILEEAVGTSFEPGALRTRGEMSYEIYSYLVVSSGKMKW
jgi:hypothetical protein